jgi:DNA invertase Pin-like site-specific DNA recombinase
MKFGYARVSTRDQNLDLQADSLRQAGREQIVQETASGAKADRPILGRLLAQMHSRDILVIWKRDRLGRSLRDLVDLVSSLLEKDIRLKSLQDPIDTTSSQGLLVFNNFASLAEFERDMIIERTQAGLSAARAQRWTAEGIECGGREKGRCRGGPLQGREPERERDCRESRCEQGDLVRVPSPPRRGGRKLPEVAIATQHAEGDPASCRREQQQACSR